MKKTKRLTVYVVAAIMALTCFVPVEGLVFGAESTGQQTAQTKAKADPYANYTGWVKNKKGKKVYYYKKGKKLKGVQKIKKTWYEFNKKSGVYKRTIGDNMDKKAQKCKSRKKFLVLVSYSRHKVRIYKGKKNNWKRIKNFTCTLGKRSTKTPRGTFKIGRKGRYFNTGRSGRCWYWTGFIGTTYLFHSVIYNRNSRPNHIIDGRLGRNLSHGCVRLSLKNARWIYRYVPRGTEVVIY